MRARGLSLVVAAAAVLALAACSRSSSPAAGTTPASALTPPPAAVPGAKPLKAADSPAAVLKKSTENGSETVEDAAGDSGSHNVLLAAVASTVAAATPAAGAQPLSGPTLWQEGTNYTRIVPAQPTDVPPGQVEVLEFFWYACPHCYALDPMVEAWRKSKPAYVTFARVPVTWNDADRSLARLFYTLKDLGKLDQLHADVFKEIHVNGNPLVAVNPEDSAQTERIQSVFVAKLGIPEATFDKAYDSMGVSTALQRADQLVMRYRIDGVPTFVINGKYVADVRSAGGPDKLLSLVADLAALEHKHP